MSREASPSPIEVHLEPEPAGWAGLVRRDASPEAALFRKQLGLPTDRPIVMSGHQAQLWHPGIVAKHFAAAALAERVGGVAVWLVVDTDTNEALSLRVPVRAEGAMQEAALDLMPASKRADRTPTGLQAAVEPGAIALGPDLRAATRAIGERLDDLRRSLAAHARAGSLAEQVTLAAFGASGVRAPRLVAATAIARTDLFQSVLARALADPSGFAAGFNEAAGAFPDSGMALLGPGEVPFWRIDGRGRRVRARAEDLTDAALLPTGLLMTGLMRLAGCDLFIHGTGGRGYEPINDQWLAPMLGQKLAPFVTASATLLLGFDDERPATPEEAAQAAWVAHHARHEPALVGEIGAQRTKRELAERIESLPRRSAERRAVYEEMLALLGRVRGAHAGEIARFEEEAARTRMLAREHGLRTDRTWAAALHDPERIAELGVAIARRFGT